VVRKDIKTGDLVLKRKKNWENPRKLHESWEGPYIAKETDMPRSFHLLEQTDEEFPYLWNADSLKRCHTCFSKENQVHTYMHASIKFHACSDI
jgi:hypothetical protein